jgi:hypothetical protein
MQVFPLKASQRESRNKGSLFGGCLGIAADTIQSPRHDNTQYSHEDQHTTWLGIEPSRVTSYLPCGRTYGALWHIILAGLLGDTNDARPFLCFAEASQSVLRSCCFEWSPFLCESDTRQLALRWSCICVAIVFLCTTLLQHPAVDAATVLHRKLLLFELLPGR